MPNLLITYYETRLVDIALPSSTAPRELIQGGNQNILYQSDQLGVSVEHGCFGCGFPWSQFPIWGARNADTHMDTQYL